MDKNTKKAIIIRLTAEEKEVLKLSAKRAGLSQQKFVMKAITGAKIFELGTLAELRRIGINLNQLLKKLHQNQDPTAFEFEEVKKELMKLCQS
jgi:predicted DNA binding CopG/RHH family protein